MIPDQCVASWYWLWFDAYRQPELVLTMMVTHWFEVVGSTHWRVKSFRIKVRTRVNPHQAQRKGATFFFSMLEVPIPFCCLCILGLQDARTTGERGCIREDAPSGDLSLQQLKA